MDVVLFEWLTFMTELSTVNIKGSSLLPNMLKFLGNNLDSSINSPLWASLTSFDGSSCTESSAAMVPTAAMVPMVDMGALVPNPMAAWSWSSEESAMLNAVFTLSSCGGVVVVVAVALGLDVNALTAAWAAACAAFSMAPLIDCSTSDWTWASCSGLSSELVLS